MDNTIRYSKYFKEVNLAGDIIFLNLTYLLSYFISFGNLHTILKSRYFELLLFYNIAWIGAAYLLRLHDTNRTMSFEKILKRLLNALGLYLLLIFAFIGLKGNGFYKIFVFESYCFTTAGVSFFHLMFLLGLKYYRRIGYNYRKVLIVGYGELASELRKFFTFHPEHGFKFLGYFDDKNSSPMVRGKIGEVMDFSLKMSIDEIYCVLPYVNHNQVQDIINFAEDHFIKVKIIPDYRGFPYKGVDVQLYDFIPILNLRPVPLEDAFNVILKRTFDVLFSIFMAIFVLSWLIPIIAILIKLDSKGPVLFKQKRSGKDNKIFTCYKFRTMYIHDEPEYKQAKKGDPRITKFGKFLRKTSLDEIPQFYNVIKGEMSVIGPRPHPVKLNEKFHPIINKFMLRHSVKPGITGLAQAKGYRGETSTIQMMKNRVKLDRFYVENWSMLFDIKILILTVNSILKGDDNAY